jgi:hypothetical protein
LSFSTKKRSLRLAQQLQAEEDEEARRYYEERERRAQESQAQRQAEYDADPYPEHVEPPRNVQRQDSSIKKKKKKGDCIIM